MDHRQLAGAAVGNGPFDIVATAAPPTRVTPDVAAHADAAPPATHVRTFKPTFDQEECADKRRDAAQTLRKQKRQDLIEKRRFAQRPEQKSATTGEQRAVGATGALGFNGEAVRLFNERMPMRIKTFYEWTLRVKDLHQSSPSIVMGQPNQQTQVPSAADLFLAALNPWLDEMEQLVRAQYPMYIVWFKSIPVEMWEKHCKPIVVLMFTLAGGSLPVHRSIEDACIKWIMYMFSMHSRDTMTMVVNHGWVKAVAQSVLLQRTVERKYPPNSNSAGGVAPDLAIHSPFLNLVSSWADDSSVISTHLLEHDILTMIDQWLTVALTREQILWILYLWVSVSRSLVDQKHDESHTTIVSNGKGMIDRQLAFLNRYEQWERVAVRLMTLLAQIVHQKYLYPVTVQGVQLNHVQQVQLARAITLRWYHCSLKETVVRECERVVVTGWSPAAEQVSQHLDHMNTYLDLMDEWLRGMRTMLTCLDKAVCTTTGHTNQQAINYKRRMYKLLLSDDITVWCCYMVHSGALLQHCCESVMFMSDVVADNEWIRETCPDVLDPSMIVVPTNSTRQPLIVYSAWLDAGLTHAILGSWIPECVSMTQGISSSMEHELVRILNNLMVEDSPVGSHVQMYALQPVKTRKGDPFVLLEYAAQRVKSGGSKTRTELMYMIVNILRGVRLGVRPEQRPTKQHSDRKQADENSEDDDPRTTWTIEWLDIEKRMTITDHEWEHMCSVIENYLIQAVDRLCVDPAIDEWMQTMVEHFKKSDVEALQDWRTLLHNNNIHSTLDDYIEKLRQMEVEGREQLSRGASSTRWLRGHGTLESYINDLGYVRSMYFGEPDDEEENDAWTDQTSFTF